MNALHSIQQDFAPGESVRFPYPAATTSRLSTVEPLPNPLVLRGTSSLQAVKRLEDFLLQFPQVDLGTTHVVHGGMCARTIFVPAGTVLTGAFTTMDYTAIVSGDITVTTDDGERRITGFQAFPVKGGIKRAGFAHADTWWSMVWRTELTDIRAIEDEATPEADRLQTRRPDFAGRLS